MVKSVYSVSRRGVIDWIVQRISAVVIALYSVWLAGYFLINPSLTFAEWHSLFSGNGVKIFTLLFLLSLMMHAWVGMWTIFTDYVKCFAIRSALNILVIFALAAGFLWGWLILWSL